MSESLESIVQELKVLIDEVRERMVKVRRISHEIYFLTGMIEEVYERVEKAREVARKVERMVEEGRYGRRGQE